MGNLIRDFNTAAEILGENIQTGLQSLSIGISQVGEKIVIAAGDLQIVEGSDTLISSIVEVSSTNVNSLKHTATVFGDTYTTTMSQASNLIADSAITSTQMLSNSFVDGEDILAQAFKLASNETANTMALITQSMSGNLTQISAERTIEMIQIISTVLLFFVPFFLIVAAFALKKTMKQRRTVLNYTSFFTIFVSTTVLITEVRLAGGNNWIVSPNEYIFMEFCVFFIVSSIFCIFFNFVMDCCLYRSKKEDNEELLYVVPPVDEENHGTGKWDIKTGIKKDDKEKERILIT